MVGRMDDIDQGLLDLLSEMLQAEREGRRLYDLVRADAPEELHPKLIEYAEQARRGALILEEAIRRLGADPDHVSPGAGVVRETTDALIAATDGASGRAWMYRALHLAAFEMQDRMIWRALDALADQREDEAGEVLRTAATAVLSQEALGAHDADRNEERIAWIMEAMEAQMAADLGVDGATGPRRGLRRPR